MAIEQPGFKIGFLKAAADYSDGTKQFRAMKVTADETFGVCSAAGEPVLAVLQDKPKSGKPGELWVTGVTKLIAGTGGLAANALWETDANGAGITCAAAKAPAGRVLIGAAEGKLATVTIGLATGAAIPA